MRIAQVVASYHPKIGGVEAIARRLAHGCVQAGDRVTVFTHQFDDSPAEEWMDGVRVLRFPLTLKGRNYQASLALFRYIKENVAEFDLVHAHSYHTLMGHAAVRTHLPFVFTPHYHGTGHTSFRAFLHRLYRSLGSRQFRAADAIICNSESERALVLRDFPWAAAKLVTIPLGTDVIRSAAGDDRLKLTEPVLLTVGRLERYKNVDLVIDAFRALPFPASLVVVGEGPERVRLEQYAKESAQGQQILFTGKISDRMLQQLFAQASVRCIGKRSRSVRPCRGGGPCLRGQGASLCYPGAYGDRRESRRRCADDSRRCDETPASSRNRWECSCSRGVLRRISSCGAGPTS